MADIPVINYDVPYFDRLDLGLGLVSLIFNALIGYFLSSLRSPFDFGIILETLQSLIGFTTISFQTPFTSSVPGYIAFASAVIITIVIYHSTIGTGLKKSNRYGLGFIVAFLIGIPYIALVSILDFIGSVVISLFLLLLIYFFHVGSVKIARLITEK